MPKFRSISFPDHKPVSIRFGDDEASLYALVQPKSSAELREALGCDTFAEVAQAAARRGESVHAFVRGKLERALTSGGSPAPYAGWPDGTADACEAVRRIVSGRRTMLDAFAGRAMYPAVAGQQGLAAFYCELSPGFRVMAEARLAALSVAPAQRARIAQAIRAFADDLGEHAQRAKDELLMATQGNYLRDFTDEGAGKAVARLARLRTAIDRFEPFEENDPPDEWPVVQLLAAAVVEALPRSPGELEPLRLLRAIEREIRTAATFVEQEAPLRSRPVLVAPDVRSLALLAPLGIDVVATNPPSLNFAFYGSALASWFLRVRRSRAERSLQFDDAIALLRTRVKRHRDLIDNLKRVEANEPRMARVAANYFAGMAVAFDAITPHLTRDAIFAIEVKDSELAGIRVGTRKHLFAMLEQHGFAENAAEGPFTVLRRGGVPGGAGG